MCSHIQLLSWTVFQLLLTTATCISLFHSKGAGHIQGYTSKSLKGCVCETCQELGLPAPLLTLLRPSLPHPHLCRGRCPTLAGEPRQQVAGIFSLSPCFTSLSYKASSSPPLVSIIFTSTCRAHSPLALLCGGEVSVTGLLKHPLVFTLFPRLDAITTLCPGSFHHLRKKP